MRKRFCKECKKYYMVYRFATEFVCPNKHTVLLNKRSNLKIVKKYLKQQRGITRSNLIKKLDKLCSDLVKEKAKGKCIKCDLVKKNVGVSHYYSRRYLGTRWDLNNLDFACWGCHHHWLEKDKTPGSWYYQYMIKKLGRTRFNKLKLKAYGITKFSNLDLQLMIDNFKKL